jgi:hypothetical protein
MDSEKLLYQPSKEQTNTQKEGGFAYMILTAYEVDKFDGTFSKISSMKVAINPESYSSSFSSHSEGLKVGKKTLNSLKLANGKIVDLKIIQFREEIKFDLWFDSTGVIPESKDVKDDVKELESMLVKYNGKIHSTNYIKVQWGTLKFVGQVSSLSIDYQLFNMKGEPIRAKASLSFTEMQDQETRSKIEDDQSPDLTHLRMAQAGDNLPLMSFRIYRDPTYYMQIAEHNDLPNLMNIQAGQELEFPPLEK